MTMTRRTWLLCYRGVRFHTYSEARKARIAARLTLLHDRIGAVLGGCALAVFFHANKIKAALRRNVREKRYREHRTLQRATQVIKRALGCYGPERMVEMLPYVNELAEPKPSAFKTARLTYAQEAKELEANVMQAIVRDLHPSGPVD
jgi:hypothetical protein